MSRITIADLEVFWCVGVPDEERSKPQRLLVTIDMTFDFSAAVRSDRIERTINYQAVTEETLSFGNGRSWRLIEKAATNLADRILDSYQPEAVTVEIKKFVIPQAKFVSVSVDLARPKR
jgi:7,8-dihydroneopterin aldolase/epimerase/oxygenase